MPGGKCRPRQRNRQRWQRGPERRAQELGQLLRIVERVVDSQQVVWIQRLFVQWTMVDIPADLRVFAAGSCSDGVSAHGKRHPPGPEGAHQGRNDYTGWFAGDPDMGGEYLGYDGPYPPFNDLRVHRYFFRLFALDVAMLPLPDGFSAADVFHAMHGHVLAEAAVHGTYSLHPAAKG
jgi:Raf kinase inhibitor-like YbhB/YbcL family protein